MSGIGDGISWSWSMLCLGIVLALPSAIVVPFDPAFGLALAVGTIPAAVNRLAPRRSGRWSTIVVGGLAGLALFLGSLLRQVPIVAVIVLFAVGVVAPLWAGRRRLGALVMALALPVMGIGLSVSSPGGGIAIGGLMLAGSLYAWAVSLLWPERPAPTPVPRSSAPWRTELRYGILLGCAGAIAAATAFLLQLQHVGWVTGACLLVMRPTRSMLFIRSLGRAVSVLVGALLAALFALVSPSPGMVAIAVILVLSGATATQGSRCYITPGFSTFLALSLILTSEGGSPVGRFNERTLETLLGVGIALVFGWAVPQTTKTLRHRIRTRNGR